MANFVKKFAFFSHSKLLRQVVLSAFLWSMGVLAIVSVYTSYVYYKEGQERIVMSLNYLEKVIEIPLEAAIWQVDNSSINNILQVLVKNPHVARAQIITHDKMMLEARSSRKGDWVTLQYPIVHAKGGKNIGTLYLSISKEQFYKDLKENIIISLYRNLMRFSVLMACLVFIFNRKVLTPLKNMEHMTKQFNGEHLTPILGGKLSKPSSSYKNEIEALHKDIQMLQENFVLAFFMQQQAKEINHEIELQLEKERQKLVLAQRLDTIGQITAQVAHDFGNLIMIINGKTKSLDSRLTDPEDLKQTESIRKATTRAHRLIKKILSMTRAQQSEQIMLDPYNNLIDLQDLLKISIGGSIVLNINTDESPKLIYVEPSSYENVIINLCVNARDAMPEGGTIDIGVKSVWKNNAEFVAISVKDSGTGIPEEIQAKIFDPFFTTKAPGKGTGLGLSQVQDFVHNLGGHVELSSQKDGTCFTLFLPNKALEDMIKAA